MPYYRKCPVCGAALDPGEICTDCQDKETAPDAANIEGGRANTGSSEEVQAAHPVTVQKCGQEAC